jgi:hypothetical protein
MDSNGKVETLNSLILNERGFVKWSIVQATVPLVIGLTASGVVAFLAFSSTQGLSGLGETAKYASTIPGLLTTAYGVFSFKDYYARKNRITSFQFLKIQYESALADNQNQADTTVMQEIDKRFWMLLDKNLG